MSLNRRSFLQGAAALGLAATGAPAIAQARTKVKVGYLHTLAVDAQYTVRAAADVDDAVSIAAAFAPKMM